MSPTNKFSSKGDQKVVTVPIQAIIIDAQKQIIKQSKHTINNMQASANSSQKNTSSKINGIQNNPV